jgi:radical SAM protein with 4Fe4S-binding SPASM domain
MGGPLVDLPASDEVRDAALARAAFLAPAQVDNVQKKCRDLAEERLVWESVPFRLMLEPNRRCNTRCIHCDIERARTGELGLDVIERLLDEIGWGTMEILPFVGGEPTLAPLREIGALARRHAQHLNLTTNGARFTRALYADIADVVSRVHVSLHSHRREVQERIAPGLSFDAIVRNVADAAAIGKQTGAQVLCGLVVMDSNLDELAEYVRFVAGLGVERVILQKLYPGTARYSEEGVDGRRSPAEVRAAANGALEAALELGVFLETNVDAIFADPRMVNPASSRFDILQDYSHVVELYHPGFCIATAIMALVEWDGTVLPCCRDRIVLGNLREQSFDSIWNGEPMQRLRETFFRRELRPFCRGCMAFYNGHS